MQLARASEMLDDVEKNSVNYEKIIMIYYNI